MLFIFFKLYIFCIILCNKKLERKRSIKNEGFRDSFNRNPGLTSSCVYFYFLYFVYLFPLQPFVLEIKVASRNKMEQKKLEEGFALSR